MKKLKIGIIDSGVEISHKKFKEVKSLTGFNILKQNDNISDELFEGSGHGTGIFSIIVDHLKNNLQDIHFYIVKIFDSSYISSEDYLIQGIEYCIKNEVDVLNLSLGIETDSPSYELTKACKKAAEKGMIIISSTSDSSVSTYPAYYPYVIGVVGGIIDKKTEYGCLKDTPIEFIGKGNLQRIADVKGEYIFKSGNSYATAHITGIISSLLLKKPGWDFMQLREYMLKNGKENVRLFNNRSMQFSNNVWLGKLLNKNKKETNKILDKVFNFKNKFSWMNKIAIYPLSSKEMRAFEYFSELCPFEIKEVYDFPKFAAKKNHIKVNNNEIKVKWDIDENSFNEIDTIVIGHPYDTAIEMNSIFADKIIDRCIEKKKNFFVFDNLLYLELLNKVNDKNVKIYNPNDIKGLSYLFINYKSNPYYESTIPSIAVIGVSPQSGKFTTQLAIKKVLEKSKYSVGWLSTEPQGEIFGANSCFPIGLELTTLALGNWPFMMGSVINGIEEYIKPDLFITGHQSGFIRNDKNLFSRDALSSFNYIASVKPDAFVCSVNPAYSNEELEKIVRIIELLYQKKILFFSLSRKKIKPHKDNKGNVYLKTEIIESEEWDDVANYISNKYQTPVVDTMNSNHDNIILEQIVNYF